MIAEILLQPPAPPSLLVANLPPSLERAIMGLLEKRPEARFPSADSLAATLAVPDVAGSSGASDARTRAC